MDAKSTLAIVMSPPSKRKLQPIPPSADWRFDLAEGCPAHCQYCYLAGSLSGPPVTRVYANIEEILDGLSEYVGRGHITSASQARADEGTTYEGSCYTDPVGIEHLTGSLAKAILSFRRMASTGAATLHDEVREFRFTAHHYTQQSQAHPLLSQQRSSGALRGAPLACPRASTACVAWPSRVIRLGLRLPRLCPKVIGGKLIGCCCGRLPAALAGLANVDLTIELITHRFTPKSKTVLNEWYNASNLDMDENTRAKKRTKFGSLKYVYPAELMKAMRKFFDEAIAEHLPNARILYWT